MTTRTRIALTVVLVAVPAFVLGPILWPPADIGVDPSAGQLAGFLLLAVGDALLLGAGVAFLLHGRRLLLRLSPDSRRRATTMYVAIVYLMVSWWPHLNMHTSNGTDLGGLLVIDLLFHLSLEIAAVTLSLCFFSLHRSRQTPSRPTR
jgi:hypothetical protein